MDKPAGPSSHDVVARVRRLFGTRAVGHAGTLDPFATGLLVLVLGPATRLVRWAERRRKTYQATARLGQNTTTDDATGAVTAEAAQNAARTTIQPDRLTIVVVGDGAKIYEALKAIGPVSIVDPEGKPLGPDDLAPRASALQLNLSALAARRDSFTILLQGNPLGWQTSSLEVSPGGFVYTEQVQLGPIVSQTTRLEIDRAGEMKSITQTGKVQGQDVSIDVRYANGRASGSARTPDPATGQLKSVTIDTAIAPGTLDDNAVQALLPALNWTAGAKWSFNVLSAGQGEIKTWTLAVTGVESVRAGGETVEAYRAELSGPSAPLTLWITTRQPHELVKIGIAGQPIEFVRAR